MDYVRGHEEEENNLNSKNVCLNNEDFIINMADSNSILDCDGPDYVPSPPESGYDESLNISDELDILEEKQL